MKEPILFVESYQESQVSEGADPSLMLVVVVSTTVALNSGAL